jgi:hypothetical protein
MAISAAVSCGHYTRAPVEGTKLKRPLAVAMLGGFPTFVHDSAAAAVRHRSLA